MKKIKSKALVFLTVSLARIVPSVSLAVIPGWNPANYTDTHLPAGQIYSIIHNAMMWILAVFGLIGIIGFVISGIMYLTAAGSEDQISKAKSAMKWSLVGVVVGLVGLVILYAVDTALAPGTSGGLF